MIDIETPRLTIPPRVTTRRPKWGVGDIVTVGKLRYIIRALNAKTGRVALASTNTVNHDVWWDTTVDKLPKEASA